MPRPVQFFPRSNKPAPASWGEIREARFCLEAVKEGRLSGETFRPNLARHCREDVRAAVAEMVKRAHRRGETIRVARVIEGRAR